MTEHDRSPYVGSITSGDVDWLWQEHLRAKRAVALVLHPDIIARDPYGVITREQIHEYARMGEAFAAGWSERVAFDTGYGRLPCYWVLRNYVAGIADIPDYVVNQIALHYCSRYVDRGFGGLNRSEFHAIV